VGAVDPNVPQVNDPELEANILRELSIVGQLGKLRVLDVVLPTFSLGNVIQQTVEVLTPSFRSTDIFSGGQLVAPAAGAVLADTAALPAGTYDVKMGFSSDDGANQNEIQVQHRNAANTATLAVYSLVSATGRVGIAQTWWEYGYELAINERLRIVNVLVSAAGTAFSAIIFARLRT